MHAPTPNDARVDAPPIPFGEFVALIAGLMALVALGIDSMLPALPAIGADLGVRIENERQYVITAYMIGFAVATLAYGPAADRFGRRRTLIFALAGFAAANVVAALAGSFTLLLAARAASGAVIAGARIVTVALVRDCFSGRAMARVMSLAFMVFMAVPIMAPLFGQIVLVFAPWRWIFGGIALLASGVLAWFFLRMPETLPVEARRPMRLAVVIEGARAVARDRYAVGYTIAAAAMQAGLYGFITTIQQVVYDVFKAPSMLPVIFGVIASGMAVGSFVNSRIVLRLGTRPISHAAMCTFILVAAVHLGVTWTGHETMTSFVALQALMMVSFALAGSNFSAIAMENMGAIAGTASSVQTFFQTLVGALVGAAIGQSFDGSTVPLYIGFTVSGLIALAAVAAAEQGRLFRPAHAPAVRRN